MQGCRFITDDLGIGLKGATDRNVIQDNEFSDTIAGWTWEDVKAEGNFETGGVRLYAAFTFPASTMATRARPPILAPSTASRRKPWTSRE